MLPLDRGGSTWHANLPLDRGALIDRGGCEKQANLPLDRGGSEKGKNRPKKANLWAIYRRVLIGIQ